MISIRTKRLNSGEIIPLTYDFMFADIFNREENIGVLEYFLSFYFSIPYEKIKGNLKINHRRQLLDHKLEANREVDLVLSYGRKKYNIEISNGYAPGNVDRNIVFLCGIHGRQLRYGDQDYTFIDESIQINLNNFKCNGHEIKESYYFQNEQGEILSKKARIDFVDLERAKLECYNDDNLAKWCRLFTARSEEEFQKRLVEIKMDEQTSNKLYDEVTRLSDDEEYYGLYTKLSHHEMLENTMKKVAREEGLKEGIEEGRKEGLQQGLEQGIRQNTLAIAKKMIQKKKPIEEIVEITGLSLEDIEKVTLEP